MLSSVYADVMFRHTGSDNNARTVDATFHTD